jgi:hypothetical protein
MQLWRVRTKKNEFMEGTQKESFIRLPRYIFVKKNVYIIFLCISKIWSQFQFWRLFTKKVLKNICVFESLKGGFCEWL